MKIIVTVKPNSKIDAVERIDAIHFAVRTKAAAREGRANSAAIRALARHLDIPKSRIELRSGAKSRQKVFEIL